MPPVEAGRFEADPQVRQTVLLGQLPQALRQGLAARVRVGHPPTPPRLAAIGQEQTGHDLILTDIQAQVADRSPLGRRSRLHIRSHNHAPFHSSQDPAGRGCPRVRDDRTASHVIRTRAPVTVVVRPRCCTQVDDRHVEQSRGQNVSPRPGRTVFGERSRLRASQGGGELAPTGLTVPVSREHPKLTSGSGQQCRFHI